MTQSPAIAPDTDAYYVSLFVNNPAWSTPQPNEDESARWAKISGFLQTLTAGDSPDKQRRILDVGCGRGWLTNLASEFGEAHGVEPVAPVAEQAGRLFPQLRFTAGDATTILNSPDFQPYDFILTSEVIEHVPQSEKAAFVQNFARLLKPGGHVILTTPRGESLQEWTKLSGDPSQPVEEWLREPELRQLFLDAQFIVCSHERVWFDTDARRFVNNDQAETTDHLLAIYQVWAFQLPEQKSALTPSITEIEHTALNEFHHHCSQAAERALQQAPDHLTLSIARASSLLHLGDFETARRILVRTTALHADNSTAHRLLAQALKQAGKLSEAEEHVARATELEAAALGKQAAQSFSFLKHLAEGILLSGERSQMETRRATINNQAGSCLYLHPPAVLLFKVPANNAGRLTTAIAIQPEAWDQPTAGGCEFTIHLNRREVFRKAINPKRVPEHRCWHEVSIDVPVALDSVNEIVFRTLAIGTPADFRWALWRDPVFRPNAA